MRAGVGVDGVQHAGVVLAAVPLRELLVHRRALGEGHVLHVARQADQHRAAGLGVDAGHGQAVGSEPAAALPGVPAEQQDVVATGLRLGLAAAGEHRRHQAPLGRHDRGRGHQAADHDQHQHPAHRREAEPMATGQLRRPGQPPGVDEQQTPAETEDDEQDLQHHQHGGAGEQPDDGRAPDQRADAEQQEQRPEGDPGPDGDPTDPLVAGRDLGRSRQHQGHAEEAQRPAQLHPLAALLRGPQRRRGQMRRRLVHSGVGHVEPFVGRGESVGQRTSASMGAAGAALPARHAGVRRDRHRYARRHVTESRRRPRLVVRSRRSSAVGARTDPGAASRRARRGPSHAARWPGAVRAVAHPPAAVRTAAAAALRAGPAAALRAGRLRSAGPPATGTAPAGSTRRHRPAVHRARPPVAARSRPSGSVPYAGSSPCWPRSSRRCWCG